MDSKMNWFHFNGQSSTYSSLMSTIYLGCLAVYSPVQLSEWYRSSHLILSGKFFLHISPKCQTIPFNSLLIFSNTICQCMFIWWLIAPSALSWTKEQNVTANIGTKIRRIKADFLDSYWTYGSDASFHQSVPLCLTVQPRAAVMWQVEAAGRLAACERLCALGDSMRHTNIPRQQSTAFLSPWTLRTDSH